MRCVTRNDATQNWIESNNLLVGFWRISLNVNKIERMFKYRLCKKVGNLAFALSANWLRINTFVCCINFRLFGFSLSDHALRKLSSPATISSYVCQKWSCPATRSPREDQALLLCRRLPLVPNKASSDAGPESAGNAAARLH